MPFNRTSAAAFVAGLLLAAGPAGAEAQEVTHPATAATVDLGDGTSAITYWIDDAEGRHVITTVDTVVPDVSGRGEDQHAVVRFSAVLLPGQTQIVTVPTFGAGQPQELRVRRSANGIEIDRVQTSAGTMQKGAVLN
jgi:hypothetical protein